MPSKNSNGNPVKCDSSFFHMARYTARVFIYTDLAPVDETVAVPRPVNSTAADSQTTSSTETPSSGVNADRQPVATQHENKPQAPVQTPSVQTPPVQTPPMQTPPVQTPPAEEKDEFMEDKSVSKEAAEILAAWPKVRNVA